MQGQYEALIRKADAAFNARDRDAVLAGMEADVQWPRAWEGDYITGHGAVRDYWTRQWQEIDPTVTPVAFHEMPDEQLNVTVHQVVKDKNGNVLIDATINHIYTFAEDKIKRMDIQ